MRKDKKNISSKYKNGMIVQTRDEYLDKTNYYSPGHPNKNDLYRKTVIVDSNRNDNVALVTYTTHKKKSPKGTLSDYVKIYDRNGNLINIDNVKFKVKKNKVVLNINNIKKNIFDTGINSKFNKKLVHNNLKKRKK